MDDAKKAVVLVNLGSPRSAKVADVRAYLKEFLNDASVIDLPSWFRYLLVYGIIAPFRAPRSAKLYEKLQTERGFPLIYHSMDLEKKLRAQLPSGFDLFLAMRYGEPSLTKLLRQIKDGRYSEILILPLYPQYASSTTGSVSNLLLKELKGNALLARTSMVPHFHSEVDFIHLWQKKISSFKPRNYDAIVFSYHGIPVRQTQTAHPEQSCEMLHCEENYTLLNEYCYRAACYQTTRSISRGLDVEADKIVTSFQSRFGRNWLDPFTDKILLNLVKEGNKKVLIVSPSFVADCLETSVEIGHEYAELFKEAGGELLTLVPSLNSEAEWVTFLARMAKDTHEGSIRLENLPPVAGFHDSMVSS